MRKILQWLAQLVFFLAVAAKMGAQTSDRSQWIVQTIQTRDSTPVIESYPMIGQYPPPQIYARWLGELVTCEGLPFPTPEQLAGLTFWEVNAQDFQINRDPSHTAIGTADPQAGRMYVSIAYIWNEETIKHELLHFLLRWTFGMAYKGGHPPEYFAKCGLHPF